MIFKFIVQMFHLPFMVKKSSLYSHNWFWVRIYRTDNFRNIFIKGTWSIDKKLVINKSVGHDNSLVPIFDESASLNKERPPRILTLGDEVSPTETKKGTTVTSICNQIQ